MPRKKSITPKKKVAPKKAAPRKKKLPKRKYDWLDDLLGPVAKTTR